MPEGSEVLVQNHSRKLSNRYSCRLRCGEFGNLSLVHRKWCNHVVRRSRSRRERTENTKSFRAKNIFTMLGIVIRKQLAEDHTFLFGAKCLPDSRV